MSIVQQHVDHMVEAFTENITTKSLLDVEGKVRNHLKYFRVIVYRKGDIVMEPLNSRDVLPKNVPEVGWGGGGVGHVGVGWGGVGHVGWGGVGGVGWVM